jgi:hypothetical protein
MVISDNAKTPMPPASALMPMPSYEEWKSLEQVLKSRIFFL